MDDDIPENKPVEINESAVKSVISSFTIFRFGKNGSESGFNMGLFPFVGILTAVIAFIFGVLLYLLADNVVDTTPFGAVILLALPLVIYGFRTTFGLMKVSDAIFPFNTGGIGPAGLMMPLICALLTFALYIFVGVGVMFYMVPALEVAVVFAAISLVYFSKKSRDERFSGSSDTSHMITAFIITIIAGVALSGLALLIMGNLDIKTMLMVICMYGLAIASGFILAKISDKRFGGMDENVFFASFDISRPIIMVLFLLLLAIVD